MQALDSIYTVIGYGTYLLDLDLASLGSHLVGRELGKAYKYYTGVVSSPI